MKLILTILVCIFFILSCKSDFEHSKKLKSNKEWFDAYGNVFAFEDGVIFWRSLFEEDWWTKGGYRVEKTLLYVMCYEEKTEKPAIEILEDNFDGRIKFSSTINLCQTPFDDDSNLEHEYELWSSEKHIVDLAEKIVKINIERRPGCFPRGLKKLNLGSNKQAKIEFYNLPVEEHTFLLPDSIFQNIEHYIQLLPFSNYQNFYDFGGTGYSYSITIETNRVNRTIICKGSLPDGLNNLMNYLAYVFSEENFPY